VTEQSNVIRPQEHLQVAGKLYPNAWKQVDMFRASKGVDLPDWPDWCFAPMAVAYAIASGGGDNRLGLSEVSDVARLSALAAWRVTQGIYRFDPDIYSSVVTTEIGQVPVDVLYRLPEWCVYIETPDGEWMGSEMFGFFAHLEWDANTNGAQKELRLLIDSEGGLIPMPVHLKSGDLNTAMESVLRESKKQMQLQGMDIPFPTPELLATAIQSMLSLVIYLCTANADIVNPENIAKQPHNPIPKNTRRHGERIFPAKKPTVWHTGFRTGAAIRRASLKAGGTNSKRPHIRRAHWHHFWQGAKDSDERKLVVKWMPPIPVGYENIDDLIPTIKSVN